VSILSKVFDYFDDSLVGSFRIGSTLSSLGFSREVSFLLDYFSVFVSSTGAFFSSLVASSFGISLSKILTSSLIFSLFSIYGSSDDVTVVLAALEGLFYSV
jgi:hypothetical protein